MSASPTEPGQPIDLAQRARHVVSTTSQAWGVAPPSPSAQARRARHGYVPQRVMRRLQSAARALSGSSQAISYSW